MVILPTVQLLQLSMLTDHHTIFEVHVCLSSLHVTLVKFRRYVRLGFRRKGPTETCTKTNSR